MNRAFTTLICAVFFIQSLGWNVPVRAQSIAMAPAVGLTAPATPVMLRGMEVVPKDPFRFDFILEDVIPAKAGIHNQEQLTTESTKLIKYFLTALAVPDDDLWVNLSPYEKDRIIPDDLGRTAMGKIFLQQDYILKQLSASLLNPDNRIGKVFWEKVYREAQARFGTTEIPVSTFNKVWITADKAVVYEDGQRAFLGEFKLKVMLEEDYLAMLRHVDGGVAERGASQIIREIILPELEHEVNTGTTFAPIRQVFSAIILANWYKTRLKAAVLNRVYTGKNKITGVLSDEPKARERIWKQYVAAYRKGVFNFIREEKDPMSQEIIPRKYFSGGVVGRLSPEKVIFRPLADAPQDWAMTGNLFKASGAVRLLNAGNSDFAMAQEASDRAMTEISESRLLKIFCDDVKEILDSKADPDKFHIKYGNRGYGVHYIRKSINWEMSNINVLANRAYKMEDRNRKIALLKAALGKATLIVKLASAMVHAAQDIPAGNIHKYTLESLEESEDDIHNLFESFRRELNGRIALDPLEEHLIELRAHGWEICAKLTGRIYGFQELIPSGDTFWSMTFNSINAILFDSFRSIFNPKEKETEDGVNSHLKRVFKYLNALERTLYIFSDTGRVYAWAENPKREVPPGFHNDYVDYTARHMAGWPTRERMAYLDHMKITSAPLIKELRQVSTEVNRIVSKSSVAKGMMFDDFEAAKKPSTGTQPPDAAMEAAPDRAMSSLPEDNQDNVGAARKLLEDPVVVDFIHLADTVDLQWQRYGSELPSTYYSQGIRQAPAVFAEIKAAILSGHPDTSYVLDKLKFLRDALSENNLGLSGLDREGDFYSRVEYIGDEFRGLYQKFITSLNNLSVSQMPSEGILAGRRILVVDDRQDQVSPMVWALQDEGADVKAETNFRKAVLDFQNAANSYELLILDISNTHLNDLNGFGVLKALRKTHPQAPVILLSGLDLADVKKELVEQVGQDFGPVFVVEKNYYSNEFQNFVARVLSGTEMPLKADRPERKYQEIIIPTHPYLTEYVTEPLITGYKKILSEKAWKLLDMARDSRYPIPDFFVLRSNGKGELVIDDALRKAWNRVKKEGRTVIGRSAHYVEGRKYPFSGKFESFKGLKYLTHEEALAASEADTMENPVSLQVAYRKMVWLAHPQNNPDLKKYLDERNIVDYVPEEMDMVVMTEHKAEVFSMFLTSDLTNPDLVHFHYSVEGSPHPLVTYNRKTGELSGGDLSQPDKPVLAKFAELAALVEARYKDKNKPWEQEQVEILLSQDDGKVYIVQSRRFHGMDPDDVPQYDSYRTISDKLIVENYAHVRAPIIVVSDKGLQNYSSREEYQRLGREQEAARNAGRAGDFRKAVEERRRLRNEAVIKYVDLLREQIEKMGDFFLVLESPDSLVPLKVNWRDNAPYYVNDKEDLTYLNELTSRAKVVVCRKNLIMVGHTPWNPLEAGGAVVFVQSDDKIWRRFMHQKWPSSGTLPLTDGEFSPGVKKFPITANTSWVNGEVFELLRTPQGAFLSPVTVEDGKEIGAGIGQPLNNAARALSAGARPTDAAMKATPGGIDLSAKRYNLTIISAGGHATQFNITDAQLPSVSFSGAIFQIESITPYKGIASLRSQ